MKVSINGRKMTGLTSESHAIHSLWLTKRGWLVYALPLIKNREKVLPKPDFLKQGQSQLTALL